jgi:hypothetical protein
MQNHPAATGSSRENWTSSPSFRSARDSRGEPHGVERRDRVQAGKGIPGSGLGALGSWCFLDRRAVARWAAGKPGAAAQR